MITRLIDFAFVVFQLLMFKVCGIIGISKIEFFNFFGTERVKQNQKKLKTIQNLVSLKENHFLSNSNKSRTFFCFFTENFTPSFPVPCWAVHYTNLISNSNILKTVRINIVFPRMFFKEYLISFLMISRLIDFTQLWLSSFLLSANILVYFFIGHKNKNKE